MLPKSATATSPSARLWPLLWVLGGCTGQEHLIGSSPEEIDSTFDSAPPMMDESASDTAGTPIPMDEPDCSGEITNVPALWSPNENYGAFFYAGADFDFDVFGRLVTTLGHQLVAFDASGDLTVINQVLGDTPLGIRSSPWGDLLMAMPDLGSIRMFNADTGDLQTVMAGMVYPYALEVSMAGTVYASEYGEQGRIFELDLESGEATVIAEVPYVLALALSTDEQTLYMSSPTSQYSDMSRIRALERGSDGVWDPEPRVVYTPGYRVDAITSDSCGYLYVGGAGGRLVRIRQEDEAVEPLVVLPTWSLSAARFGSGLGGFEKTQLYLTDGTQLFTLDLGLDGRHVLAP